MNTIHPRVARHARDPAARLRRACVVGLLGALAAAPAGAAWHTAPRPASAMPVVPEHVYPYRDTSATTGMGGGAALTRAEVRDEVRAQQDDAAARQARLYTETTPGPLALSASGQSRADVRQEVRDAQREQMPAGRFDAPWYAD